MITEFGKNLRKLRIDHGEILMEMANKLKVTPSFLSAVEVGKKNVPSGWTDKIADLYNLSGAEKNELEKAAADSVVSVKLNLSKQEEPQRRAALVFARNFDALSDEDADKLLEFFKEKS